MTEKTKMSNLESYVELSIQIATLDMKLNKILELLSRSVFTNTTKQHVDFSKGPHTVYCNQVADVVHNIKDPLKYWLCVEGGTPGKWEEREVDFDTPMTEHVNTERMNIK